jgi:hypothetical protein
MRIRQKPLLGAPTVDVSPPIACHRGTQDSCSGFGVCRTRRLTQETVDLYCPRVRVKALRPVGVSLCIGLVCMIVLLQEVPIAPLYIGRDGCGAITILVGSKEVTLI